MKTNKARKTSRVKKASKATKREAPLRSKEEQRSYTMSRIKSSNTSIECALRKALWHEGIRYRKNYKALPGTPDIAITKHRVAVFCDGEFWHGKDWDADKARIKGNRDYWVAKIERNMRRDSENERRLRGMGWTVVRFWGEDVRRGLASCVEDVKNAILQAKIDASNIDGG
jgi:DNA mismatch endonuclease (patch repair protein)